MLAQIEGRQPDILANSYPRFACTSKLRQQAWAKMRVTHPLRRLRLSYGMITLGSSI